MNDQAGSVRTHVITGAGSGIGLEVARLLAARGDRLILLLRDVESYADLPDDLLAAGADSCVVVPVDLADPTALLRACEELAGSLQSEGAEIDSLVYSAGVVDLATVAQVSWESWQEQVQVNLSSPALLTAQLLPRLRAARGTVVFVNSTAALQANAGWSAYVAAKAGLRAFADSLREEERSHGVRVTSVFPSRTATPMQERVHAMEGKPYDADHWMTAVTVAEAIVGALDLPANATMPEVILRTAG